MFYVMSCWFILSPIDGAACFYISECFISPLLPLYLFVCSENATYSPNFKILFFHCSGSNDFTSATALYMGTRWRSWLRLCATSRKAAGSIPGGVIGIFPWG